MSAPLPSFDDVRAAAARLAGRIVRTPLLRHRHLDEVTGATVLVKPEPLQRTGSFKLRGATNAVLLMDPEARRGGIVTHSSGNHGQACAAAAHMLGMRATIAMPADAPAIKVEATRRWGAEIVPFDRHGVDRDTLAGVLAAERSATIIPPFDHPDVIAGQGTAALELLEDAGALGLVPDAFAVCTGGGGLTAGCVLALEALAPRAEVYAVEPEGWDDTKRSLEAGRRVPNTVTGSGLCDALLSKQPGALTFAINHRHLAGGVVVTEAEVFRAMRFAFEHLKIVAEPGGAVALAAVLAGKVAAKGGVVGVVVSGGNVDPAVFARALAA
ncbi:threonine/serine dehydratase [Roseomonas sp. PWR1]|uniref:Threonine/serine dehydratase n=1 Tax=Roseomonas nitratireducens TaxID=2820810 RepID=A0ABS4AV64_9PROT|nr:threonine/serine dehydratase [Neoroseomonas nitratireducens]MBP0465257.1 threonine/serine dehydratase [Neoroseomonas nitratireducens]